MSGFVVGDVFLSFFEQDAEPKSEDGNGQTNRVENEGIDFGNAILHDCRIDAPNNGHCEQIEVCPKSGAGVGFSLGWVHGDKMFSKVSTAMS